MKKFWKNYKSSIILLGSIIVGGILGLIFKEKTVVIKPLGDLFLNLLLVIIVPLIFLTITTSIGKMKQPKRLSKILTSIVIVFIITSVVSVLIGIVSTRVSLVNPIDSEKIVESLDMGLKEEVIELNLLERTVSMISVNNFSKLFTNENMIALILFSVMIGIAINMAKEKGSKFLEVLDSANSVVEKFIKLIMYYAPIGLGAYFATMTGSFGNEIAFGYLRVFIIYTIAALFIYFVIYSLYAFIGGGKKG
ncbi:MAG: dicarboxylate/amino acid:cation symporter, partial [Mollicutes bacterium]|nr:dicarboxylate/amino acid:cation symporter [Mollicutes bacterium]